MCCAGLDRCVAYDWWKSVPAVNLQRADSLASMEEGWSQMPVLAKPSVRFRKTINTYDDRGRQIAVNAQHYAVLVTDVEQGPYPEIHR